MCPPSIRALESDETGGDEVTGATLFALVWEVIVDVLGTAAAAAIVRRATGRAVAENPELGELTVFREDYEYRYTLPRSWSETIQRPPAAFGPLAAEIGRLLLELTGIVVIRKLEQIPELRARGIGWRSEEAN